MRSTRLIAALLLTALLPPATVSSSAAAEKTETKREIFCVEAPNRHHLCAHGKEVGDTNKFVAYGRVSTYTDKRIKIQRRACGTCDWRFYKRIRTSADEGRFRTQIEAGLRVPSRICYRVVVPETRKYRTTRLMAGCIVREKT